MSTLRYETDAGAAERNLRLLIGGSGLTAVALLALVSALVGRLL